MLAFVSEYSGERASAPAIPGALNQAAFLLGVLRLVAMESQLQHTQASQLQQLQQSIAQQAAQAVPKSLSAISVQSPPSQTLNFTQVDGPLHPSPSTPQQLDAIPGSVNVRITQLNPITHANHTAEHRSNSNEQ